MYIKQKLAALAMYGDQRPSGNRGEVSKTAGLANNLFPATAFASLALGVMGAKKHRHAQEQKEHDIAMEMLRQGKLTDEESNRLLRDGVISVGDHMQATR